MSNELLSEVTKVLRYRRMVMVHGQDEGAVYDFAASLHRCADFVVLDPLANIPTRDRDDLLVLQTAMAGEADVLCTIDRDFYGPPGSVFFGNRGIAVMTDAELIRKLKS